MPQDELNPYQDRDETLRIVQQTVALIMQEVNSLTDITNDSQKSRLFANVLGLLNQLGVSVGDVFPAEIAQAYGAGYDLGGDLLNEQGVEDIADNLKNGVHAQAVQSVAVAGYDDMQAAIRTAGIAFISTIDGTLQSVQDQIAQGILSGAATRDITKAVQKQFQDAGLTSFITSDGKKLPLDFYAMTVTRTKVREAHVAGSTNRYVENGYDLVRFNQRSATCKVCGERQHLIVSLTGETAGYPTVSEIGKLPPFHPNCRHYVIPVTDPSAYPPIPFDGRDSRTASGKKQYSNEQKIRAKANQEKKLYAKMKAEAEANGQSFPKIGAWRRSRRKNDEKWKELQRNYRNSIASIPSLDVEAAVSATGNIDNIRDMQAELAAFRVNLRQPPTAATREADITPFASDQFDLEYQEKRNRIMIQGMPFKFTEPLTDAEKAGLNTIMAADTRETFLAAWHGLEDAGQATENINNVGWRLEELYKRKEELFNVQGYNIALGRPKSAELGEGLNSMSRDIDNDEEQAILNYTGSQSTAINQYFREGKSGNKGVEETSAILDKLIQENELTKDVMLFRGANHKSIGSKMMVDIMDGNIDKYIGAKIKDLGYTSTSIGATTSFKSDINFSIMAKKGTKGLYVEKHTATMGEYEVLLPRGTEMTVKEIKYIRGKVHLLVEV